MERGQASRFLRRLAERARTEVGHAGATDPTTGQLFGSLSARDAIDSGRLTIGPHTYGSPTVNVGRGDRSRVQIGDYCSIAATAQFMIGGAHRPDWVSTYPFRVRWGLPGAWQDGHPRDDGDITIGNDVWIGAEAMIMGGVTVGDGAVIGARAVVTRDVRPYAIAVGVPAREVRRRFSDEKVAALLELRWWDWPEDRVRAHVALLSSPDVEALVLSPRTPAAPPA